MIDNSILIKMLFDMTFIRLVEESIVKEYKKQEMRCPTHLSIGQEAVSAGVCANLSHNDFAVSGHRAHAHYLAKGGNLKAMISEIYGKETGCSKGMGGSMHLVDTSVGFMGSTAIVGGTIPVGVGLGLSIDIKNEDRISVVFLGDGSTEEGVFYESVNFVATKNLPVLFVCENNLYSVYSPLSVRQPKNRKIYEMVQAIGIKSDYGDGNDAVDVFDKTQQAISFMKENNKPYFLEFDTYRHLEHCGPNFDNDIGYRSESEFLSWLEKDPIKNFENYLLDKKIINDKDILNINDKIMSQIKEAFDFAKKSDFPNIKDMNSYLYKDAI